MYSTVAYLYRQQAVAFVIEAEGCCGCYFPYKYSMPYAQPLTLNQGADNVLLFEFQNQAQKPVNIAGRTFMFRVIGSNGATLLLEKPMVILSASMGRAKVTFYASELNLLTPQPAAFSITESSGNLTQPVFTDASAGASAPLNITAGVMPVFVPSTPVIIPTVNQSQLINYTGTPPNDWPDWAGPYGQNQYNYNTYTNTEFYSSEILPRGPITTVQYDLTGYTGTVKAQAAQDYQSVWVDVTESVQWYNETGTRHLNIIGWHPLLRMCFNNSLATVWSLQPQPATAYVTAVDGVITAINVVNPGNGYLAPPLVIVSGDGAGCIAEAVMGPGGTVDSITVINGGSGYRPMLPTGQPAQVTITCGFVDNVFAR